MGYTDAKWDGAASNYKDTEAYCNASMINDNTGDPSTWTQDKCKLPYKTPDGDVNTNALASVLGALNGARGQMKDVSSSEKKTIARKLKTLYSQAKMDIPDSLNNLAQ